jgi:hypothetical protein
VIPTLHEMDIDTGIDLLKAGRCADPVKEKAQGRNDKQALGGQGHRAANR